MRPLVAAAFCLLLAIPAAVAYPTVPTPPFGSPPPSQPPGTCDPASCSPPAVNTTDTVNCLITIEVPPTGTCIYALGPGCSGGFVPVVPFVLDCGPSAVATASAWSETVVDVPANAAWLQADGAAFATWAADYTVCDLVLGNLPPCPL